MRKALLIAALAGLMTIASPSGAATQTVRAAGFSYLAPVVVALGNDTVTLQNLDVTIIPGHTFTIDAVICKGPNDSFGNPTHISCNTGTVSPGGTGSVTLLGAAPGTYVFYCQIHVSLGMQGRLQVR